MTYRKKLIEVALPLHAINLACVEDKNRKTGHIRNIHKWFAPMPLPALRAILFASLVDDPSNKLNENEAQEERKKLFRLLESILKSDAKNIDFQNAKEIIKNDLNDELPIIVDPFCGGCSTITEAQRLGLPSFASDLNPIPILIARSLCVIPQTVRGIGPISPNNYTNTLVDTSDINSFSLDVEFYAQRVRDIAWKRIGHFFPVTPTGEVVTAWRWAWSVPTPDPRFSNALTPLVSNWILSKEKNSYCWVEPIIDLDTKLIHYRISNEGNPPEKTIDRSGAKCLYTKMPISLPYIREQGKKGKLRLNMLAYMTESRTYSSPCFTQIDSARKAHSPSNFSEPLPEKALGFRVQEYGFKNFSDLFTHRQSLVLQTFSDIVSEIYKEILTDAENSLGNNDERTLIDGGSGFRAYADSIVTILGICVSKMAQSNCILTRWYIDSRNGRAQALPTFDRNVIPMIWDFTETNPFGGSIGDWNNQVKNVLRALNLVDTTSPIAKVKQLDARQIHMENISNIVVLTDPPYYDNIGYADLSDFFYIWLRRSLKEIHPDIFSTVLTPKNSELIATPYRHSGSKKDANEYFRNGFKEVFKNIATIQNPAIPLSIVYAFKQSEESEKDNERNVVITGWDAMLSGLIDASLAVVATWPMRTTRETRMRGIHSNALASAVILVCRPRSEDAPKATRRQFLNELNLELPRALKILQQGNIAPVDLAQASIGPGIAIFSKYAAVLESDGSPLRVRTALQLINQVLDEFLAEQEGEFDSDTRWALTWFEQYRFTEGQYGDAETLSKAKNTSVQGMVEAGILTAKAGKVQLLSREDLPIDWKPENDTRLPVWEITQHLIRALDKQGEIGAAELLARVGSRGELARDLAYRLYSLCDREGWTNEAIAYNSLVISWPEITRLANESKPNTEQLSFL
jgi:putative DNA methylase